MMQSYFESVIAVDPVRRIDNSFDGVLDITTIEHNAFNWTITATLLPGASSMNCSHCGGRMVRHGRYVHRVADLPYVDDKGRGSPVQYTISAQRYQCTVCIKTRVEDIPASLRPILTDAALTKRLSEWLIDQLKTETTYQTLATLTGYSAVWVNKWSKQLRELIPLPPKPFRPGPRKRV